MGEGLLKRPPVEEALDRQAASEPLPRLTEVERRRLLVEWNATQATYPSGRCIHHLFEEQVERTPEALAVDGDVRLTYRELGARSNQLAHRLRRMGVGPEVRVGICMTRSPEMVVGLLGVLKAGGAYVAVDPGHPAERVAFLLRDAAPRVLLSQRPLLQSLPEHDGPVVCLDSDWNSIAHEPCGDPPGVVTSRDLAYLLYTSGSTGEPKGAMIEHESVVNYLAWLNAQPDLVRDLPVVTSITFDAVLKQIFAPLVRGDAVWLLPGEVVSQPDALLAALAGREGAGLNCVPSLWQSLMATGQVGRLSGSLRSLLLGGEQLTEELLSATQAVLPDVALWNLYGPTEATANASATRLAPGDKVTVGRPIANTALYILDPALQPAPIGVIGELYIGGAGLARGYWRRPMLTAAAFIPNPFAGGAGSRIYRTGDRARYWPDGRIELVGRIDHQVKVRGFRIELGEVEAAFRRHPAIREAVVAALGDPLGDRRLVGYLVPRHGALVDQGELQRFLRQALPDYMVPSTFVAMDALPLTPNGKVDRRALPPPDAGRRAPERREAPRDSTTEQLRSIVGKVLRIEEVNMAESFYELGGHSLAAIQVVARVREALRVDLPFLALYEAPTLEDLVAQIEAHREPRE